MAINFITTDHKLSYCLPCKNAYLFYPGCFFNESLGLSKIDGKYNEKLSVCCLI